MGRLAAPWRDRHERRIGDEVREDLDGGDQDYDGSPGPRADRHVRATATILIQLGPAGGRVEGPAPQLATAAGAGDPVGVAECEAIAVPNETARRWCTGPPPAARASPSAGPAFRRALRPGRHGCARP